MLLDSSSLSDNYGEKEEELPPKVNLGRYIIKIIQQPIPTQDLKILLTASLLRDRLHFAGLIQQKSSNSHTSLEYKSSFFMALH